MSKENWNYIINGRKGAIIINKKTIVAASTHNDCIDILFDDLEYELEDKEDIYQVVIGDIYEKAIVLYYYEYINNREIKNKIQKYCLKNNLKLFLADKTLFI